MAAEIGECDRPAGPGLQRASMRPRRMAAEIPCCRRRGGAGRGCFNEAAANGRGNPTSAGNSAAKSRPLQ